VTLKKDIKPRGVGKSFTNVNVKFLELEQDVNDRFLALEQALANLDFKLDSRFMKVRNELDALKIAASDWSWPAIIGYVGFFIGLTLLLIKLTGK
jgi:hypothetical protein